MRSLRHVAFVVITAALAAQAAPERRGYAPDRPTCVGRFENEQLDSLVLLPQRDGSLAGELGGARKLKVRGAATGATFAGKAGSLFGKEITAQWEDGRLHVHCGDQDLRLWPTVACADAPQQLGEVQADPQREWTVAIYMGADSNLDDEAMNDLGEMEQALPEHGVEVIVLVDRSKKAVETATEWSDARVFRMRRAQDGGRQELAKLGEIDSTDVRNVAGFVAGAFRTFPSKHHALVVWDHGGGWRSIVQDDDRPGEAGAALMFPPLVHDAVRAGLLHSGVGGLDLLAFDACLMAHLEVAIEYRDLAQVMVASQAVVAGTGLPYDKVLPMFAATTDPRELGVQIVAAFGAFSEDHAQNAATFAAIDLAQVDRFARALDAVAGACLPKVDALWPGIARSLFFAESYVPRTDRAQPKGQASVDLQDVLRRLQRDVDGFPAVLAASEVLLASKDVFVARHHGEQRALSRGLSVFAPFLASQQDPLYAETMLGRGNRWPELLAAVHARAAADAVPVALADLQVRAFDGKPAEQVRPFDGARLHFTASGRGIVQVTQLDCRREDDVWVVARKNFVADPLWPRRVQQAAADDVDLVMPQFVDGRNELSSELLGMAWVVSNGAYDVHATVDLATPSTQAPILARAVLTEPGGTPQEVVVAFHRAWWFATEVYVEETQAPGVVVQRPLEPSEKAEIEFVNETIADDGKAARLLAPKIAWGTGPFLHLATDPPGRYRARLIAQTMTGATFTADQDYELVANAEIDAWKQTWQGFDRATLTGTWPQQLASGPDQWRATKVAAQFAGVDPQRPALLRVLGQLDGGKDGVTRQLWHVDADSELPTLRIVTEIEDGRFVCWFGPACRGVEAGRPWLAMKAVNVGGVLWRWHQQPANDGK